MRRQFQVTIDGRPAECLRMNHASRDVLTERVTCAFRFTYWRGAEPAFRVALAVSWRWEQ